MKDKIYIIISIVLEKYLDKNSISLHDKDVEQNMDRRNNPEYKQSIVIISQ
jgi:hypothetical protein